MQQQKVEKRIPVSDSNDTHKILLEYENNRDGKKASGKVGSRVGCVKGVCW